MAEHNQFGHEGEAYVTDYLIERGYVIRETNWHSGNKEIDIIAESNELLVFVEVKSRSSDALMSPFDAIDRKRIRRMVDAARAYIQANKLSKDVRFDAAAILKDGDGFCLQYIEDAFIPPIQRMH
ncbi:MAG: YraN family protein [Paludibacteraceae bacterium]|nr:YraN family protein [Paludibacteraceae bacterium]